MSTDYLYGKKWRLDRARGIKRLVDPGPARVHVEGLLMAGASLRSIAAAAGVSSTTVCTIANGRGQTIKATVASALLAVTLDDTMRRTGGEDFVLKVGAVRRLQALMALGHRATDIAATGHVKVSDVHNTVNQQGRWISHARHVGIAAAYDALAMTTGPSDLVRRRSAAKGWPPPLAWDDDTIDDPNATPDLGIEQRHDSTGHVDRMAAVIEDAEHLLDSGTAPASIPARLGYKNADGLARVLTRAGRYDLAARLQGREAAA